ncbi:unnamed protein product [[Candida] boidinii]|nr:unnamed protein product [[Candida] boidinii]
MPSDSLEYFLDYRAVLVSDRQETIKGDKEPTERADNQKLEVAKGSWPLQSESRLQLECAHSTVFCMQKPQHGINMQENSRRQPWKTEPSVEINGG